MGIARTVAGLIFQDNFERALGAPGANWDILSGSWTIANSDWSGVGTVLRAGPDAMAVIRVAPAVFGAARAEMVIQCEMRRQGTSTVGGGDTAGDNAFPYISHRIDAANRYSVVESNSGINTVLDLSKLVANVGTVMAQYLSGSTGPLGMISHKFSRKTAYQKLWWGASGILSAVDVALAAAAEPSLTCEWLLGSTSWAEFNNFSTYKNNRVRLTAMPAGHKLRLVNRNRLAAVQEDIVVVESGGVAEVELEHRICPLVQNDAGTLTVVELLQSDNTVLATLAPADGVWGGDEYVWEATWTPGPAAPNTAWTPDAAPPVSAWAGCGAPPATVWEQC